MGRIEYIVGADGRVLTKESRDAAKEAGTLGGKTYSDEFTKELRKKWGGPSGFAATLGKYDKQVIRQFQELGGFTSKAYAGRFEKTLVPAYQATAKRMIAWFENLKFDPLNGVNSELKRIFANTTDVEGGMRKLKDVLDEIEVTSRLGIIDRKSFDIGAVNQLRDALQEVFDTQNWDMLTASQRRAREEVERQTAAVTEAARVDAVRLDYAHRMDTIERRLADVYREQSTVIGRMLVDRNALAELTEDEQVALLRTELQLDRIGRETREWRDALIDSAVEADRLQDHLDAVFNLPGGTLDNDFAELAAQVSDANAQLEETEHHHVRIGNAAKKLGPILLKPWTSLDNDVRLVIGLIASAADQVAVLGSAAGAGLLGLAGAATTAIGGAVGFATIISRLNDDLDELPAGLRGAAIELQGFTDSFGRLRDDLALGGADDFSDAFASLQNTLSHLTGDAEDFGAAVGEVFAGFASSVRPGSEALRGIQTLIQNTADLLPDLADATGIWASSLVRGINRAMPLAEDLLGWIEELGQRFSTFTRSNAFGDWVDNSRRIFGELGELLDQVGRSLNNLATPAAVDRTAELLQNLTRFIPALEGMLDVLGRLDIVGIVVKALAELGDALAPLNDEFAVLADSLRAGVFSALEGFAQVLAATTTALQPFIGALVAVIAAVPPEVWSTLAGAATLYFTALSAFNTLTTVTGVLTGLSDAAIKAFDALTGPKVNAATGMVDKISDRFGKAGLVGAVAAASVAIGLFASDALRDFSKVEKKMTDVVASGDGIQGALEAVQSSFWTGTGAIEDYGAAFTELKQKQDNFLSGSDALWNQNQRNADTLQQAFHELDAPLTALAQKSLPEAQEQFAQMAADMGLTDEQVKVMLDEMPQLQAVFAEAAGGADGLATSQETLQFALEGAASGAGATASEIGGMGATADSVRADIGDLSDSIRNFGDTQISTIEATSAFEQSIDDLTASIAENGGTLDLNTQQGRDNQAALLDSIQAAKDHAAAVYDETGNIELANSTLAMQKSRLEDTLRQLGLNEAEVKAYTDQLNLIPADINTNLQVDTSKASGAIQGFITRWDGKRITLYVDGSMSMGPGQPKFNAAGGVFNKATLGVYGEAGPEAIVPLNRPLSLVDPSVRALSAYAQGLTGGGGGGGGGIGANDMRAAAAGRVVNVAAGAIQVNGSMNPQAVAVNVLTRLAERVGG